MTDTAAVMAGDLDTARVLIIKEINLLAAANARLELRRGEETPVCGSHSTVAASESIAGVSEQR